MKEIINLENGDIIEYRNGKIGIVILDKIIDDNGYGLLTSYDNKLNYIPDCNYDIIKIYSYKDFKGSKNELFDKEFIENNCKLLWERNGD